jgi:hypothetical protein
VTQSAANTDPAVSWAQNMETTLFNFVFFACILVNTFSALMGLVTTLKKAQLIAKMVELLLNTYASAL